ncbi:MAG: hypothetical protein KAI79_19525 [Bacteroidales bacterium]|nr:hypothetical protein [Bacteroidales bacterium]
MKHLNVKYYIWILAIVSSIVYMIYIFFFPIQEQTLASYFKPIPTIVTIDVIFSAIFIKWLWKCKFLNNWLVPFPNLNGTWKGTIKSTWVNPDTGERLDPIPAILTIKQSFSSISCIIRTEELTSRSFSSDFVINDEEQILKLVYSYECNTKKTIQDRNTRHVGTASVDIIGNNNKLELEGEYWTDRKTTGNIVFKFWKKELVSKYPNKIGKHPMSVK